MAAFVEKTSSLLPRSISVLFDRAERADYNRAAWDLSPRNSHPAGKRSMAQHESAVRRVRRNDARAAINRARLSRLRTFLKKVETAIVARDRKAAVEALKAVQPLLQRGVTQGALHKNTAARKMSRLNMRIKAIG
jgi:small subunit ribosomal protein S20